MPVGAFNRTREGTRADRPLGAPILKDDADLSTLGLTEGQKCMLLGTADAVPEVCSTKRVPAARHQCYPSPLCNFPLGFLDQKRRYSVGGGGGTAIHCTRVSAGFR